jgi:protein-serine/threonine kinase
MAQVAESRNDDEEAGGDAEQSSPVTFAVLTPH